MEACGAFRVVAARHFFGNDGSVSCAPVRVTADDIPWLRKQADAGHVCAAEMLQGVLDHGTLHVWIGVAP
jgi:hypothetical protein